MMVREQKLPALLQYLPLPVLQNSGNIKAPVFRSYSLLQSKIYKVIPVSIFSCAPNMNEIQGFQGFPMLLRQ
jgi:hypothetical protein